MERTLYLDVYVLSTTIAMHPIISIWYKAVPGETGFFQKILQKKVGILIKLSADIFPFRNNQYYCTGENSPSALISTSSLTIEDGYLLPILKSERFNSPVSLKPASGFLLIGLVIVPR